jgi:hypothetical protein
MAAITQTCVKCSKQFVVIDPEQSFLKEKGIPLPNKCPECRYQARSFLRGSQRRLFRTNCQRCGKETIISYDPASAKNEILCKEDYNKWLEENETVITDPLPSDANTAEGFFKEMKRLMNMAPYIPVHQERCGENTAYADHVYESKNLEFCFDILRCENSAWLYDSIGCTTCVDCDYSIDSQLCYESVDANICFDSNYLEDCTNIRDSSYCVRATNSNDLFGCVNLQNKSFCIFNRQLSETEYREQVKKYKAWPAEKVLAMIEELKLLYPLTQTHESNNENSPYGNYVYHSKNSYMCFNAQHNKECGYIYESSHHTSCYDVTYSSENELCYEVTDSGKCFNSNYVVYSYNCQDSWYVINGLNVKDSLGSVNRGHRQYEILNRKFSKEDYEQKSKEILKGLSEKNLSWADLEFH